MVDSFWKYGSGYGNGSGYGDGSGNGYGRGYGKGYGKGCGYGNGSGSGDGDGSGYGSGKGYGIKGYVAVDGIYCRLLNQKNNCYKVETFPEREICYLADYQGEITHGKTLKEAAQAAKTKFFTKLNFAEKKTEFLELFQTKKKLSGKVLYEWHGILTGSCKFGRDRFCEQHNIDLQKKYTLGEFVKIVKDDFGGDKIKELLDLQQGKTEKTIETP